ncbi:MAG: hypothetical protein AAB912_03470, partial [Patescibacteria group bacterium]
STALRFIDPRTAVPNAHSGAPLASPLIDLIALAVSLERKKLEVQRYDANLTLEACEVVNRAIETALSDHIATPALGLLIDLVVRSAYTACRCTYCLAPERMWLYEHMRSTTEDALKRVAVMTREKRRQ